MDGRVHLGQPVREARHLTGGRAEHRHRAAADEPRQQAGPAADDADAVLQGERAGDHGRRDLAHRMPDHRAGRDAVRLPHAGEADLDREQHRHRVGGAAGPAALFEQLPQAGAALVGEEGVQIVDGLGERGLLLKEPLRHARPLRPVPGEDPHGTARSAERRAGHHTRMGTPLGESGQTVDEVRAAPGGDGGAGPSAATAPVQGAGDVRELHVLVPHPLGEQGRMVADTVVAGVGQRERPRDGG